MLGSDDESEEGDLNDLDGSDCENSIADTDGEDDDEGFAAEGCHFSYHFLEKTGGEKKKTFWLVKSSVLP